MSKEVIRSGPIPRDASARLVSNRPDVPSVKLEVVKGPATPACGPGCEVKLGKWGERHKFREILAILAKPFLYPTVVSEGGGRTIGGGTSKDALRRAKKQRRGWRS